MNLQDRQRLEALRISPQAIAKAEEVLAFWGTDAPLFVPCSYCGQPCYNPEIPRGKYHRKKLPSELFWDIDNLGFEDPEGVICWPCDDARFQW